VLALLFHDRCRDFGARAFVRSRSDEQAHDAARNHDEAGGDVQTVRESFEPSHVLVSVVPGPCDVDRAPYAINATPGIQKNLVRLSRTSATIAANAKPTNNGTERTASTPTTIADHRQPHFERRTLLS
jgi:hypothetical protein